MKHYVEWALKPGDDQKLLVEVEEANEQIARRAANPQALAEAASQTLEAALERIKPAMTAVTTTLREFNSPDEMTVEFGIKLSAAAGVVVASASTEGNFSVKMTWKRPAVTTASDSGMGHAGG